MMCQLIYLMNVTLLLNGMEDIRCSEWSDITLTNQLKKNLLYLLEQNLLHYLLQKASIVKNVSIKLCFNIDIPRTFYTGLSARAKGAVPCYLRLRFYVHIITVISGGMEGDKEQSFDPDRFSYTRITRDLTTHWEILNIAASTSKKKK